MDKKEFTKDDVEYRQKQISLIKEVTLVLLEEFASVEAEVKDLFMKKRVLKMDIDDLKEGRLDRIQERQEKDSVAREVSPVLFIKRVSDSKKYQSPYHCPYDIELKNGMGGLEVVEVSCSVARQHAVGTYTLSSGEVVHVR